MPEPIEKVISHIPRLRRYARALVGDTNKADDLVQDCLTRALSRLGLWRAGSDMRAWLFTIMHNVYVNDFRKQQNKPPCLSLHDVAEQSQIGASPDEALKLSDLETILRSLPVNQLEVVLMIGLEGLSYQQVAGILKIPVGTVMSRLHRGRNQLRSWLTDKNDLPSGLRSVK